MSGRNTRQRCHNEMACRKIRREGDNQKEDLQCVRAGSFEQEGHGEARVLIRADAAMRDASPFSLPVRAMGARVGVLK